MGRSNAPPNVPLLSQSEPPSTSALSEPSPNAESTLCLVSRLSLCDSSSLVSVDGDSGQETVCSLSPIDDDRLYHDASESNEPNEVHLHQLIFNGESRTNGSSLNRRTDGRAYGLAAAPLEVSSVDLQDTPSFPALSQKAFRGASASTASSTGPFFVSPISLAASRSTLPTSALTGALRPSRRAVVVGINYTGPNHDPSRQLRYGVNDARRVASSLRACDFPAEAVIVLTDQEGQEEPKRATHEGLISWIDWLVKDAKAGDLLVFFFSGHGCPEDSSLVMEDGKHFGKDLLHNRLVLSVPQNCDLHVMLDCCSASSMIELRYCIGRMFPKPQFPLTIPLPAYDPTSLSPPVSPLPPSPQVVIEPSSHMAFAVALSGAVSANVFPNQVRVVSDPRSSFPGGDIGLYHGTTRRGASVVAVSPRPISAGTQATYPTRTVPFIPPGIGQASISPPAAPSQTAPTRGEPRGPQAPVQSGHNRDYFLERPGPFVKPAGRVIFWASTGVYQPTFEAYNGRGVRNGVKIRNGIVPNAICAALDACAGSGLIVRDLWRRIVGHIEQENDWRRERDAAKISRPNSFFREQCAELWVSQPEPLSAAGPVLDRLVFSAQG